MQVIATEIGFDNLVIRQPGDVFTMPDGSEGTWFTPIKKRKDQRQDNDPQSSALGTDDMV